MARVLGKGSQSLQQWRPQTDYERWLEEHNENYQPGQDAQYHPSIPGYNGQVPVTFSVLSETELRPPACAGLIHLVRRRFVELARCNSTMLNRIFYMSIQFRLQ